MKLESPLLKRSFDLSQIMHPLGDPSEPSHNLEDDTEDSSNQLGTDQIINGLNADTSHF